MPPRTLRSAASHADTYIKRAVVYHATAITVLWVVVLFFSFAMGLVLLVQSAQIAALEQALGSGSQTDQNAQAISQLQSNFAVLNRSCVKLPSATTPTTLGAPTSADAVLTRGAFSPDGKKYAGYDDVTVGKKGIGVRVGGEAKVRHILIFNPRTESSGVGTPDESTLSVRWTDNQNIDYDVLVKNASGAQTKETRSVKIYF